MFQILSNPEVYVWIKIKSYYYYSELLQMCVNSVLSSDLSRAFKMTSTQRWIVQGTWLSDDVYLISFYSIKSNDGILK